MGKLVEVVVPPMKVSPKGVERHAHNRIGSAAAKICRKN